MAGFTKLFNTIVSSTIWREDSDTRVVWVTMLAMADRDGHVEASNSGPRSSRCGGRGTNESCDNQVLVARSGLALHGA